MYGIFNYSIVFYELVSYILGESVKNIFFAVLQVVKMLRKKKIQLQVCPCDQENVK